MKTNVKRDQGHFCLPDAKLNDHLKREAEAGWACGGLFAPQSVSSKGQLRGSESRSTQPCACPCGARRSSCTWRDRMAQRTSSAPCRALSVLRYPQFLIAGGVERSLARGVAISGARAHEAQRGIVSKIFSVTSHSWLHDLRPTKEVAQL